MRAKDYLKQLEIAETKIRNIQFDIAQLKDIAFGVTTNLDGNRVQSSGDQQKMASAVDRWVDKEREMNAVIDRLIDLKLEIARTIEKLDSAKEIGVLHMFYVQGKSFKEIAAFYNKSVSWATTVHGRALQSLQKAIDKKRL